MAKTLVVVKVPHSVDLMLRGFAKHGGGVGVCCACMDARGLTETELADGARRSTLDQLAAWTQWADKTLVF